VKGSPVGPEGVRSDGVGKIIVGLDFDVYMGGGGVVNGAGPRAIANLTSDSSFLNRPHRGRCLGGSFLHRGLRESVGVLVRVPMSDRRSLYLTARGSFTGGLRLAVVETP
jgi:hypothetical protein